jgi:type VI secretion system protein ImpA
MTMQDDLELLRRPITEDSPAGEELRYEGTYDRIQDARREDDPTLAQGIWQTTLKRADWATVERIAMEALTTRTKDLQIAVWLIEARMELHGFEGARSGLEIAHALCDLFWSDIYPKIEEGNLDYRLSPIEWMNEKLSGRLKNIAITRPSGDESLPCSWSDLESAQRLENLARKDPKAARAAEMEDRVTMARFDASMMLTPEGHLRKLLADIDGSIGVLGRFGARLGELCGHAAPSLGKFRDVLDAIRGLVAEALASRGVTTRPLEEAAEMNGASHAMEDGFAMPMNGAGAFELRSRSDAYAMLSSIADYLARIEPHSPTPYLLKRAVTWGSMPLPALLAELMEQGSDLARIHALLGIRVE